MNAAGADVVGPAGVTGQPSAAALDYCFGAAGDEATMARNEAMLDRSILVPRVLAGGPADPSVTVTGGPIAAPVLVAPMGLQGLLDRRAETVAAPQPAALAAPALRRSTRRSCMRAALAGPVLSGADPERHAAPASLSHRAACTAVTPRPPAPR